MKGLRLAFVLAALASGCGGSVLAAHRARVAREARATVPVELRFVEGQLRLVVRGTLDGALLAFAVDTGATDHSLTRAIAGRLIPHDAKRRGGRAR